jgi:ribosomal protein S18 acetylase RimI-like enzyme
MIRRLWDRRAERDPPADTPPASGLPASELPATLGPFTLIPADATRDRPQLLDAYASCRQDDPELTSRHPDSRQAVIEHEFESRQLCYPVDFPGVELFLLTLGTAPAGRIFLQANADHLFLVDLVLLPAFRGQGHGTALLQDLIRFAHASRRPLRLHVAKNNPRAAALYQRLGFRPRAELAQHWLLERPV